MSDKRKKIRINSNDAYRLIKLVDYDIAKDLLSDYLEDPYYNDLLHVGTDLLYEAYDIFVEQGIIKEE